MKILYHHRIRSKDGQYVHVAELVAALRRRGHAVQLVEPRGTRDAAFGANGGAAARLKQALPGALYELLELAYGGLATIRLLLAWLRVRPDILYERYNLHLPAGALVKRLTGTPLLLEVNAPLAEERARYGGLGLLRLAGALEAWVWRSADRVIVVSGPLAKRVVAAGVPRSRIAVMPNGIDPERFRAAPSPAWAKSCLGLEGRLVLGFVGFVRSWHGLERILDWLAASGRKEIVLLLIGDGPARPGLERQARRLGLGDRFRCTGLVDREQVRDHLAAVDIALQPSVVDYASPLKLFEYMAMGLAIIAPDSANIREVLTHGRDALLAAPERVPEALDRLACDPALRSRLGAAARQTVRRLGLTWDDNARRVEELVDTCRTAQGAATGERLGDEPVQTG